MPARNLPLDTWVVVEPGSEGRLEPLSTHATQEEAERERDRRNAQAGDKLYSACKALQPVAARLGCAVRVER